MFGVTTSDDYKPVAWMGRYPLDITMLLVAIHVGAAILACFLLAFGGGGFLTWLMFDSAAVLHSHAFHEIATYALVHTPYSVGALLWFAIEMYMLFSFGREIERFIGRNAFIALYLTLLFLPGLVLTLTGFWIRVSMAGSGVLHFGVFLAFATIYPSVEMSWLRVQMKWIALILLAIGTLTALATHDWASLLILWVTAPTAYLFIRARGIGGEVEWWTNLISIIKPKPKFTVVPKENPRRVVEPDDIYASVDPILDKIAKSGIGSLTAGERRALDRARNRLLKKPN